MKKRKYRAVSFQNMVPYLHITNIERRRKINPMTVRGTNPLLTINISYTTEYYHRISGETLTLNQVKEVLGEQERQNMKLLKNFITQLSNPNTPNLG